MINLALSWPVAATTAAALGVGSAGLRRARRPRLVAAADSVRETGLVLALYALWQYAGSFSVMGPGGALARARWIWHLERTLHLPSEAALQRVFLPHPLIIEFLNLYYLGLHFPVLIGCMIWLFIWHRDDYRRMRTTLVV
ncbi:MAG: phosphatase PAP2 family protein, partial [Streptosporangiaceae bacterium]